MHRLIATALLALTGPLAAQTVPTVTYDRPDARFPEPLSLIQGFRALDANRAVAADPLEGRVTLVNFADGSMTDIGRQGGGPGEYGAPGPLFAKGDETLMLDMGNRRLLRIVNGQIARDAIPLAGGDGQLPIFPRAVDAQGRIYYDLAGVMSPATIEYTRRGRAPLLRFDPSTNRTDTLGMVSFPPTPAASAGPGEVRVSIGGQAYQARDAWAITPEGRVGVVRAAPYHVQWLGARPATGPDVAYRPVPVGEAEKNAWADQFANRGMTVTVENGRRQTRRPPRPDVSRIQFPETMPAFSGTPIVAANGELWVERSRPARETARTYDVFDAQGLRVRQAVFPANQRVLTVGNGFIMTARTDGDGLEWIERFRAAS